MKHPILYRIVFYSAFVFLVVGVLALIQALDYAPYKASDMGLSYQAGCQFASRPLDDHKISTCKIQADMFQETLQDLDEQMEAILESRNYK